MELDTGASCAIISKSRLQGIKPEYQLLKTDKQFASYTGHYVNCVGCVQVNATLGKTTRKLKLYVVKDNLDTLFGREWIEQFAEEIDFAKLFSKANHLNAMTTTPCILPNQRKQLDQLLIRHKEIFSETAGKSRDHPPRCISSQDRYPSSLERAKCR